MDKEKKSEFEQMFEDSLKLSSVPVVNGIKRDCSHAIKTVLTCVNCGAVTINPSIYYDIEIPPQF